MSTNEVWIALKGGAHEDGSILGVYATKESADARVIKEMDKAQAEDDGFVGDWYDVVEWEVEP